MLKALPLLILPVVVFLLHPLVAGWYGPRYFDPNSDPQYPYILNSLAVATGSYPGHMDHPGTSVQALGGLALRLAHPTLPREELITEVLTRPEEAGRAIVVLLTFLSVLILFAAAWVVLARSPYGLSGAALFQAWPFLFPVVWVHLPRASPDFFLFSLAQLFCALILTTRRTASFALYFGALLGLIMVTKISALLFLLVPAILFWRRWKLAVLAYSTAGAAFALVVGLVYGAKVKFFVAYFLRWFWGLASRTGWYGEGEAGLPKVEVLGGSIWHLAGEIPVFFAVALVSLAFSRKVLRERGGEREAWICFVLLSVCQVFLLSKAPEARYALPVFPASGAAVLLLLAAFWTGPRFAFAARAAGAAALLFALWALVQVRGTGTAFRNEVAAAEAHFPAEGAGSEICIGIGSGIDCGLHFGSNFSHGEFAERLQQMFPRHYQWDGRPDGMLLNMKNERVPLGTLLRNGQPAFFHGRAKDEAFQIGGMKWKVTRLSDPNSPVAVWKAEL